MRISDWSSDVCSSDLGRAAGLLQKGDQSAFVTGQIAGCARQAKPLSPYVLSVAAKLYKRGVDIAFAADRRGVAPRRGDRIYHLLERDAARRTRFEGDEDRTSVV